MKKQVLRDLKTAPDYREIKQKEFTIELHNGDKNYIRPVVFAFGFQWTPEVEWIDMPRGDFGFIYNPTPGQDVPEDFEIFLPDAEECKNKNRY